MMGTTAKRPKEPLPKVTLLKLPGQKYLNCAIIMCVYPSKPRLRSNFNTLELVFNDQHVYMIHKPQNLICFQDFFGC